MADKYLVVINRTKKQKLDWFEKNGIQRHAYTAYPMLSCMTYGFDLQFSGWQFQRTNVVCNTSHGTHRLDATSYSLKLHIILRRNIRVEIFYMDGLSQKICDLLQLLPDNLGGFRMNFMEYLQDNL